MKGQVEVVAMIMAGGMGSRLSVLSEKRAKPAVPFGGIYRIIDFTLSNVMQSQISIVGICTQYKPYSLMDHVSIGEWWGFTRRGHEAKILPPYTGEEDSDWYAGTSDAICQNLQFIERYQPQLVLILSGDHVYQMDYRPLIAFHCERRAALTVSCQEVPLKETSNYGIVEADETGRIVGFQEKPKEKPRSNLANLGIYVFNTDVLMEVLRADARNPSSSHDFGHDVIPGMISSYSCYAHLFSGYWRDVGTYQSYWQSHMDMLDSSSGLDIARWQVCTAGKNLGEGSLVPARIYRSGRVDQSVVSWGCRIEGVVRHSVLSPGVRVRHGAVVEDSVLLNGVEVGAGSIVRRAIVDKACKFGERCVVGAQPIAGREDGPEPIITLVGKGAELPPDYLVCPGVLLAAGIKPADLPPPPLQAGAGVVRPASEPSRPRQ